MTAVSGIPEAVQDGATGMVVPPGDPEATAAAMLRLHRDRQLASRLGRRAQDVVRERFDGERLIGRLVALFQEALA